MKRRVTILYDRIEDDVFERAKAAHEDTSELVPIHVGLGEALVSRGHEVKKIAAGSDVRALFKALASDDSDVIFNVCDGLDGETKAAANVVALLELLKKPFTGSGSVAMRLAGDKTVAKQLFQANGIATPRYAVIARGELRWADSDLKFPLIVKPTDEDASVGITERSVVTDVSDLLERVSAIHEEFKSAALIEEFIAGREIYAAILGNERAEVLPILEWPMKSGNGIGSYDAKWATEHENFQKRADFFPEDLPEEVLARIRRDAILAYRALKLTDYARVDIRLADDGTPYFLEANPNPFFDVNAEVATAAQKVGLDYADLAERVIDLALERVPAVEMREPLAVPGLAAAQPVAPPVRSRKERKSTRERRTQKRRAANEAVRVVAAKRKTSGKSKKIA